MAKRAASESRLSEAFMNNMIALEIIFSEKESTTSSITSRVAVVTHIKFNKNLEQMKKDISRLYNVRSNFVHNGSLVDYDSLTDLKGIVFEVYCCLLRLQLNKENHSAGFLNRWLKNVDLIKATLEAGQKVESSSYLTNGIAV
jgi:hypothetical protein